MFNTRTVHTVSTTTFLDKIFEYIPANAFIHKGRCGIGGTTLELINKNRCSIIVAPTVGILVDKKKSHPDLFIVYAKVTPEQVEEQLQLMLPAQKMMTTPEGLKKVMDAAEKIGIAELIREEWFLLLDECHTFITEDYRKQMLRPFQYFWSFVNKAIISATPYFFTDERFQTLDYHKIEFTEKLGTITLVDCKSVAGTLNHIIQEGATQKGSLHIFINSVTEIKLAIERSGKEGIFSIYCADDEDKSNMNKLGDLIKYYAEQPDEKNFSKINFYTSKYFEGWDLKCKDATIVLVTDIHKPHTKVSIGMKLKQAAGRLRNKATRIMHLTNTHNIKNQPKSIESFKEEYIKDAHFLRGQYLEYLERCKSNGHKPEDDERLSKYAEYSFKTRIPELSSMKIDQQINHAYSDEMYNNIELIKKEWEDGYYKVEVEYSPILLETNTTMKRKSRAQHLKEDYLTILNYNKEQGEELTFHLGQSPVDKIRNTNPLAYQAAKLLKETMMKQLSYNVKRIQAEVILAANTMNEIKLLKLLNQEFQQGQGLPNSSIIDKLQGIYYMLEIREVKSGEIKKAKATDLIEWFDIDDLKLKDDKGKFTVHGWLILRAKFNLRVAA